MVIHGRVQNGVVVLEGRVPWPDGTEVAVAAVHGGEDAWGMREEDWPTDPEGIARHLALVQQTQALEISAAEEAEWEAARKDQKEFELAKWDERWRKIESQFE